MECSLGWNYTCDLKIEQLLKLAARVRFEITSMISDQNFATRGSITTLLHAFWNHPDTGLGPFKYFIDAVLSRFEIKSSIFLGFQNRTSAQREFDLKSQVWFQTKIARLEVQLPLYYIHFEIAQIQDLISSNILLMQYWTGLKLNSSILGREK